MIMVKKENINKILYGDCFGVWIYNEPVEQLILLFDLNWEKLIDEADKSKLIDIQIIYNRVRLVEEEMHRRRGIR